MLPSFFYPKQSHVLLCDFRGFVAPEMIKRRPVVVVSPSSRHDSGVCLVVPLSTTAPAIVKMWHIELSSNPNPLKSEAVKVWAKCDMLYTVSFARLDKFHRKTRNGREYIAPFMNHDDFARVLAGVHAYLGLDNAA